MISSTADSPHALLVMHIKLRSQSPPPTEKKSLHFNWKIWFWELTHTHSSLILVLLFQSGSYSCSLSVFQASGEDRICVVARPLFRLFPLTENQGYKTGCCITIRKPRYVIPQKFRMTILNSTATWPAYRFFFLEITWLRVLQRTIAYIAIRLIAVRSIFVRFLQYGCPNSDAQP